MKEENQIRILFLADCSEKSIQAQDRDSKEWALFLNPDKYKIFIFCQGNPDVRLKNKTNIKIIYLHVNKLVRLSQRIFIYLFKKVDVVMTGKNWKSSKMLFKINKYLGKRRKIVISIVNQVPYDDPAFSTLDPNNIHIFAISKKIKSSIKNYFDIDVPIVHGSYDLSRFIYRNHYNKKKKIICVASLQARKQPFLFANIAKEIPEVDFVWVGDGYYMNWLKEKIKKEKIFNLKMIGIQVQEKLATLLSECDIFLFPSIHEGFPGAVTEAMACGLPVIAFDTYGPEAIIDGKTGYIVKSEFEMLEKLKYLLNNVRLMKKFGENARRRALDFEGSKIIKELENFIDEIIKE